MIRKIFSVLAIAFFAVATFLIFPASVSAEELLQTEATQQANQANQTNNDQANQANQANNDQANQTSKDQNS